MFVETYSCDQIAKSNQEDRLKRIIQYSIKEFRGGVQESYCYRIAYGYMTSCNKHSFIFILTQKPTHIDPLPLSLVQGIALVENDQNELVIDLLIVRQHWKLGTKLMDNLITFATNLGCKSIVLNAVDDDYVLDFYKRNGFIYDSREKKKSQQFKQRGEKPMVLWLKK